MLRLVVFIVSFVFLVGVGWSGPVVGLEDLKVKAEKSGWKVKDYGKKFKTGLKGHSKSMPKVPVAVKKSVKALPAALDYREKGLVSRVKDQASCGSCWAFAATGVLESVTMWITGKPNSDLDLSEQVVVSCDAGNQGCNGGYMDVVSEFLRKSGTGLEGCYPYNATNGLCSSACSQRYSYKIDGWGYVATTNPDLESIKNALYMYGPLVTTMVVYSDFMYYSSGVYKYTSGYLEGYHAIIIVGYDDVNQCFIVKNSWGPNWGESGFFRIGYSELSSKVLFGEETIFYVPAGQPPPPPTCTYDLSLKSASFGSAGGSGTFNVTATGPICDWTAVSNSSWLIVNSGGGNASGVVQYAVSANATTSARTGTITIGDQVFTVNQEGSGGGCNFFGPKMPGSNAIKPWW